MLYRSDIPVWEIPSVDLKTNKAMRKSQSKSNSSRKPEWAAAISELRQRLNLSQTDFAQRLHSSAMGISRWERGAQEPPSHSYIELGNLAGASLCWYFWGRAGLRSDDLMRVLPKLRKQINRTNLFDLQIAHAGGGTKSSTPKLVAIPLLKVSVASHGEAGDSSTIFREAPVESMIAAPEEWCPNPSSTSCVWARGTAMMPLIGDGYILAVDSSQTDSSELNGKVVVAWHKDRGLMVSRLRRYDHTDVLQPENREHQSIIVNSKNDWKIFGKVLWWIGIAP
jgi:DNA-binding transcriptional regulator YiaG